MGVKIGLSPERRQLADLMRKLTQEAIVLGCLASHAPELNGRELASTFREKLLALARDQNGFAERMESYGIKPTQVNSASRTVRDLVVGALIVRLDAATHGFLDLLLGRADEDSRSFETDLAILWPKDKRGADLWAYRCMPILAELRNAFAHERGFKIAAKRRARLLQAGWEEAELDRFLKRLESPGIDDLFVLKDAVRVVCNRILELREAAAAEGSQETGNGAKTSVKKKR